VTHFVTQYGLGVVAGLVFLEAVGGFFVPGETAFIVASALASQRHGNIVWIIVATVAASIAGTVVAYVGGRTRGGIVSTRPWLRRSDTVFREHGAKALFFGRFIPVLRTTLGWMAGACGIERRRFLVWTVAGCVTWACAVGTASYYLGEAVVHDAGVGAAAVIVVLLAFVALHRLRRRLEHA
jgi:membrane-associated protein